MGAPDNQRLADQLNLLQRVTAALAAARSEEEIGDAVVEVVLPAFQSDGGVLALVTGNKLTVARTSGYGKQFAFGGATFELDARIPLTEAARTARPITFATSEERLQRFPGARRMEFR